MSRPLPQFGPLVSRPRYSVPEAAVYVGLPPHVVKYVVDRRHSSGRSLIHAAPGAELSFLNLLELHVLRGLRKRGLKLPAIRRGIEHLRAHADVAYPLLEPTLRTDGHELFYETFAQLLNASRHGQGELRAVMEPYLDTIEWSPDSVRLFPMWAPKREVSLDPTVAGGQPVLEGTRVLIPFLVRRHEAGASYAALAEEYRVGQRQLKAAVEGFRRQVAA